MLVSYLFIPWAQSCKYSILDIGGVERTLHVSINQSNKKNVTNLTHLTDAGGISSSGIQCLVHPESADMFYVNCIFISLYPLVNNVYMFCQINIYLTIYLSISFIMFMVSVAYCTWWVSRYFINASGEGILSIQLANVFFINNLVRVFLSLNHVMVFVSIHLVNIGYPYNNLICDRKLDQYMTIKNV